MANQWQRSLFLIWVAHKRAPEASTCRELWGNPPPEKSRRSEILLSSFNFYVMLEFGRGLSPLSPHQPHRGSISLGELNWLSTVKKKRYGSLFWDEKADRNWAKKRCEVWYFDLSHGSNLGSWCRTQWVQWFNIHRWELTDILAASWEELKSSFIDSTAFVIGSWSYPEDDSDKNVRNLQI